MTYYRVRNLNIENLLGNEGYRVRNLNSQTLLGNSQTLVGHNIQKKHCEQKFYIFKNNATTIIVKLQSLTFNLHQTAIVAHQFTTWRLDGDTYIRMDASAFKMCGSIYNHCWMNIASCRTFHIVYLQAVAKQIATDNWTERVGDNLMCSCSTIDYKAQRMKSKSSSSTNIKQSIIHELTYSKSFPNNISRTLASVFITTCKHNIYIA